MVCSQGVAQMTDFNLLIYTLQVVFCVATLLSLVRLLSIPQPVSSFPLLWGLGVALIAWRFGNEQQIFYSSDQVQMVNNILTLERDGFSLHPEVLLGRRDMITIPAWVLWKAGMYPLLTVKFLQAVSLLLTITALARALPPVVRLALKKQPLLWLLFVGPSLVFNSLLALRDQVLVAGVTWFYTSSKLQTRAVWLLVITLLRPHLGVAALLSLVFVRGAAVWRVSPIRVAVMTFVNFIFGVLLYTVGDAITTRRFSGVASLFSQERTLRLLAAFSSLNFLVVDSSTVDQSFSTLLLARIVFYDTWLIPLVFAGVILVFAQTASPMQLRVLFGFSLFAGISSETDFVSSRQLTPFFPIMALASLATLVGARVKRSQVPSES